MNKKTIIAATIITVLAVAVAYFVFFKNTSDFQLFKNQKQIQETPDKNEQGDLNNNGAVELYQLTNGRLTVSEDDSVIWQSPADWWVDNFALADSDNNGQTNINLSVWKNGNFGSSKPFWIKENDQAIKNHFFVFGFRQGEIKPLWQSSNLSVPNCDFTFADVDADGKQDLVVIEGTYGDDFICKGEYLAVWKWNGWGFSNAWRSEPRNYEQINLNEIPQSLGN